MPIKKTENQEADNKKKNGWSLKKVLRDVVIFLVIFTALQVWLQRNMAHGEAPNINSVLVDGKQISLASYQGKPLLLHFWASWCPICKFEQGAISDIHQENTTQILTIAFQSGNKTDVVSFMEENRIAEWPTVVDEQGIIANSYGVTGVPATFFIDRNGEIRFKTRGLTSKWGIKIRLWLTDILY